MYVCMNVYTRVCRWPPAPNPNDLNLSRVLCIRGPQIALAMLDGAKVVENRSYKLPLGWHALYISKGRDLKGLAEFKFEIDQLQYSTEVKDKCYCKLIGAIFVSEIRTPEECYGYSWAKGPHCHIISHTCTLTEPVSIQKPNDGAVRWTITNEDEQKMINAKLPDVYPKPMDLAPVGKWSTEKLANRPL